MNKKKVTSWGVSFSSLALVAGMIGYLGTTNKNTSSQTNTVAQTQASTKSSPQNSTSISYKLPTDNSSSQQASSSEGQHGGFDTTTGGT